MKVEDKTF